MVKFTRPYQVRSKLDNDNSLNFSAAIVIRRYQCFEVDKFICHRELFSVDHHTSANASSIALDLSSQEIFRLRRIYRQSNPFRFTFQSGILLSNHLDSSSDNVHVISETDELAGFIEDRATYVEQLLYLYNIEQEVEKIITLSKSFASFKRVR